MSETFDTTGTLAPPPPPQPHRQLYRSRTDRKVAGVCGGLAAYLGIDPIILRILVVVLSLFGGSGLLLYAAGWLLLAEEGQPRSELQNLLAHDGPARPLPVLITIAVIVVVVVGAGSVFDGPRWLGSGPDIWPLLAIGGIGFAVWYSRRGPHGHPPAAGPLSPPPVPSPAPATAWSQTPAPAPWYGTSYPAAPPAHQAQGWALARRRRKCVLGALTLSTALLAAGVMLPLDRTGVWHLHVVGFLAVLLMIIGLGLVVGAFMGRSRGLIVWGVLLSFATAVAAAVPAIDVHGTGNVHWRPTSVSSIPADGYRWAAGDTQLDLTALPPTATPVTIRANLGAGTMVVLVPAGARVVLDANVGLGNIRLPDGSHLDGVGRELVRTLEPDAGPVTSTLNVRLDLGAGTVEVRRAQA